MKRKQYTKPAIERIELDSTISLVMMSPDSPTDPGLRPVSKGRSSPYDSPFNSPFKDKPFN